MTQNGNGYHLGTRAQTYKVLRWYNVAIDSRQVAEVLEKFGPAQHLALVDACTRYADIGSSKGILLYREEGELSWGVYNDVPNDEAIVYGPVSWSCSEEDVDIT